MIRLVTSAAFFVLALSPLGCGKATTPATKSAPAPALAVKASTLLKEYAENAVGADTKYKGKFLKVTGKFGTAKKAPLLGYAVQILPEDGAPGDLNVSSVQCFIDESAMEEVGKFKPGQMIAMEGICDGVVLEQIKLSKCTVAK